MMAQNSLHSYCCFFFSSYVPVGHLYLVILILSILTPTQILSIVQILKDHITSS